MNTPIPLHRPDLNGRELEYVTETIRRGRHASAGDFAKRSEKWLTTHTGASHALLSHSCTAALETAALVAAVQAGDEVIMASFTFVSTATAFVLRGAVPVFVDIRPDTLNIDESKIEAAITKKTRCVVPMHYGAVACEMEAILGIAKAHSLFVVEDAAQCIRARYRGKHLGTLGDCGTLSFHETKNVSCGHGGAFLTSDSEIAQRAEVILDKGTNRQQFLRGQIDKYTWRDVGFSGRPSELNAAFLLAQLERADAITDRRLEIWNTYHREFSNLEIQERVRRPIVPADCEHNAHVYYLLMRDHADREAARAFLNERGVGAVFHYVPLHDSPAGERFTRAAHSLHHTVDCAARLLRLPLFTGMTDTEIERVVTALHDYCRQAR